uniref:Uncharacterized protein n=1 Tax=Arundo donax TaxID=35708 RepID=A0A0A8YQ82_ARUDO
MLPSLKLMMELYKRIKAYSFPPLYGSPTSIWKLQSLVVCH